MNTFLFYFNWFSVFFLLIISCFLSPIHNWYALPTRNDGHLIFYIGITELECLHGKPHNHVLILSPLCIQGIKGFMVFCVSQLNRLYHIIVRKFLFAFLLYVPKTEVQRLTLNTDTFLRVILTYWLKKFQTDIEKLNF